MDITEQFHNDYNNYIDKLIEYRDKISGTHKIDFKKSQEWIDNQLNDRRRNAAEFLIQNTHYITFNKLFEDIRNSVVQIYKDLDLTKNIYMFISERNNSFYFIGMIALYFIKLLKYKLPICVNYFIGQTITFDDASYTGGQFFNTIKDISAKIYLGLSCITNISEELLLGEMPYYNYKLKIYAQNKFVSLDIINKDNFNDLIYYFSPFTYGRTKVSIYFDHKIADPISTFMKMLNYGPILPKNLNYPENLLIKYLIIDPKFGDGLFSTTGEFIEYMKQMEKDESKIKNNVNKIRCIPFISNCDLNIELKEIINNTPYDVFCLTNHQFNHIINNDPNLKHYKPYLNVINELNNTDNRCPISFYKNLF